MNYESMTDRELDALVAEKVMGATLCEDGFYEWHSSKFASYEAPNYATSIRGAFHVVEAMRERGHDWQMDTVNDKWAACAVSKRGNEFCSQNKSLPRAIVIAALRALDA